ncbi:MAG TPA: ThiF family adenylyltransferase [Caulobacteraceae bacterium]|nr:ThiF family adenylyltransferase [Caulobacteraceae bacterium]
MEPEQFYAQRDDRTARYGERRLDPQRAIIITADTGYLQTLEGQVAVITLANLLSRMSPSLSLGFPDVALDPALPFQAQGLHAFVLGEMRGADPFGRFEARALRPGDYAVHLGPEGPGWITHGSGWNAYIGPSSSPLPPAGSGNPFGAAFAAIMAAAAIFNPQFPETIAPRTADTFGWTAAPGPKVPLVRPDTLGSVWIVGAGSVGSAVAYFLALCGFRFDPLLIDMDIVKIHNLDRSPVFTFEDLRGPKVEAVKRFLATAGLTAAVDPTSLRRSTAWQTRQAGTPDLLVSAANEDNVRYDIEQGYPPVQVFGTTGKSWQATVFTLAPPHDPCSCCLFPPEKPADTACATDKVPAGETETDSVDAALPFLSFAAGLMTAIEIAKLGLPERPPSGNRAYFQPLADEVVMAIPAARRPGCGCEDRYAAVHQQMVGDGRYRRLYAF